MKRCKNNWLKYSGTKSMYFYCNLSRLLFFYRNEIKYNEWDRYANIGESMRLLSLRNVEIDVIDVLFEEKKCNVRLIIHEMINKKNINNFIRVAIRDLMAKWATKFPVDKLYNWLLELLRTNTHRLWHGSPLFHLNPDTEILDV